MSMLAHQGRFLDPRKRFRKPKVIFEPKEDVVVRRPKQRQPPKQSEPAATAPKRPKLISLSQVCVFRFFPVAPPVVEAAEVYTPVLPTGLAKLAQTPLPLHTLGLRFCFLAEERSYLAWITDPNSTQFPMLLVNLNRLAKNIKAHLVLSPQQSGVESNNLTGSSRRTFMTPLNHVDLGALHSHISILAAVCPEGAQIKGRTVEITSHRALRLLLPISRLPDQTQYALRHKYQANFTQKNPYNQVKLHFCITQL